MCTSEGVHHSSMHKRQCLLTLLQVLRGADVHEVQTIWKVLVDVGACSGDTDCMADAPQQPAVYSQGKELQDLSMTVGEAGLLRGQRLSFHARWACLYHRSCCIKLTKDA